jgi:FkbM family methyltransferase
VISVEADPRAASILRDNARLNGASQVQIVEKAIGAAPGRGQFRLATQLGWSTSLSSGVPMVEEAVVEREIVTVDTLVRQYIPDGRSVDFVKLDVEGSEIEALKGAAQLLAARTTIFLVEVNTILLQAGGHSSVDLLKPFFDAGYAVMSIQQTKGLIHRRGEYSLSPLVEGQVVSGDVLAVPPRPI